MNPGWWRGRGWLLAGLCLALVGCERAPTPTARQAIQAPEPYFLTNGRLGVRIGLDGNAVGPWFVADAFLPPPEERLARLSLSGIPPLPVAGPLRPAEFPRSNARMLSLLDAVTGDLAVEWRLDASRPLIVRTDHRGPTPKSVAFAIRRSEGAPTLQSVPVPGTPPGNALPSLVTLVGPAVDVAALRQMEDVLRSSFALAVDIPPGPFGLSDSKFDGHVFWDADVWMFPALMLTDPDAARTIPTYRVRMAGSAAENFRAWQAAGEPTTNGSVPKPLPERRSTRGNPIRYPWQSAVTGRELAPGDTRWQEHVTGSVILGLRWAAALGLADQAAVDELTRRAADYYVWRASAVGPEQYGLRGVVSPDEWHQGDHDLYTNLLADTVIRLAPPPGWSRRVVVPRDAKGLLNYEGDLARSYQQAAALLAVFPLQHPVAEAEALALDERFGLLVTPNGPAMSLSLSALVQARFGDPERALATWRQSWQRYTTGETLLFSERPGTGETYFLTGAAGCLNAVLYGFMGLRLDPSPPSDAPWRHRLRSGWWLSARPNLPREWRDLTVSLNLDGQRIDLTAPASGVVVARTNQQ